MRSMVGACQILEHYADSLHWKYHGDDVNSAVIPAVFRWLRWDHFMGEIWIFEKETLDLYCAYELRITDRMCDVCVCVVCVCVYCVPLLAVGGPVIGIQDPRTCICKNLIDIRIIMEDQLEVKLGVNTALRWRCEHRREQYLQWFEKLTKISQLVPF